MPDTTTDAWLARAVGLAYDNVARGDLPFGAVVVAGDVLVADGVNTTLSTGDPTCHAEVQAVRAACSVRGTLDLEGCTIYTSCEPCAMCVAVAATCGIPRLVFACSSADADALGFPATPVTRRLQDAWRTAAPAFTSHGTTSDPQRPFRRWNELRGGQR